MLRTAEDDETEHEEETGDAPQPLKCKITFSPELIDTSNVKCCGPESTSATRHQIEYGATQATEQHGAIWYLVHRRPAPDRNFRERRRKLILKTANCGCGENNCGSNRDDAMSDEPMSR